ncbi:hypothetical protein QFC20_005720 [Naganishia adeliensis]|uniref:Uncharacterized protein n=1 Tax=Naganishia adeliensis TaxID=92952 RepID=A0ACC2VJA8_9TREE|nr:hypothetical protein QFC20_005720 [Naganishia adeliensis]
MHILIPPPGLGTVVRRVRDLGREVHHVVDHAHVDASQVGDAAKSAVNNAEAKLKPLARAATGKMDQLRDTAGGLASRGSNEVEHRLDGLPTRADPTTADTSLGQRLLATFGNPWSDARKTRREAESLQSSASGVADRAANEVEGAAVDVKNTLAQAGNKLAHVNVKDTLVRTEENIESVVTPLAADVRDSLVRVEEKLANVNEKLESAVTPLAVATGEKMDQLRETTADLASRAADEFEHRLETLPARSDPATADATLARRLIETFGNPWTDARKTQQELQDLQSTAAQMADRAAREVEIAKEKLANVDVKETLVRAEEQLESVITPLAAATGEKMDQLRETTSEMAARVADDVSQRIDALPARADPATANPSLASRLFNTFGNPAKDDLRARQELEQVAERARQEVEHVAERAGQEWEKLANVDVKQTLERAEAKVESVVSPFAAATGERMDRLRDATMDRAAHVKNDLSSTVNTTSHEIQDRLESLPERGVDNAEQGVDPILASQLVATFGNAHDDARVTRQEIVQLAPGGQKTVERVEESVRGARNAAERVVERAENVVEEVVAKEKAKTSWWSRS